MKRLLTGISVLALCLLLVVDSACAGGGTTPLHMEIKATGIAVNPTTGQSWIQWNKLDPNSTLFKDMVAGKQIDPDKLIEAARTAQKLGWSIDVQYRPECGCYKTEAGKPLYAGPGVFRLVTGDPKVKELFWAYTIPEPSYEGQVLIEDLGRLTPLGKGKGEQVPPPTPAPTPSPEPLKADTGLPAIPGPLIFAGLGCLSLGAVAAVRRWRR